MVSECFCHDCLPLTASVYFDIPRQSLKSSAMNVELYTPPKKGSPDPVLGEIAALEKRIFPKHESMSSYLKEEVNRRGTSLMFVRAKQIPSNSEPLDARQKAGANEAPPPLVGYIIFTASSLMGNITKLAGEHSDINGGQKLSAHLPLLLWKGFVLEFSV